MKRFLLVSIRLYQLSLRPWLGHSCRFYPTCSDYAAQAIQTHGSLRGGLMSLRRVLRCHPWHAGGLDPVPNSLGTTPSFQDSREESVDRLSNVN